jgi:PAS domain-containing protein
MYNKKLIPYYTLFDHAPLAAAILDADSFKIEMANSAILKLWDRPLTVVGNPLLDCMPELTDQIYPLYLKSVFENGNLHQEVAAKVILNRRSKKETVFMDYSYTPIFGRKKQVTALLVLATDVCERELNRLAAKQHDRDLRLLVKSAPVAMCIYRGPTYKIEAVNDYMLNLWQNTQTMHLSILNHVYHNFRPYHEIHNGITYSYTPIGAKENGTQGVCMIATIKS